jgi:PAS domain S-box-containing protein
MVSAPLTPPPGEDPHLAERKCSSEPDAQSELLALILRSIADGIIVTDGDARVTLMNQVAEVLTGWSEQEARGLPLSEVFKVAEEKTGTPLPDLAGVVLKRSAPSDLAGNVVLTGRQGTKRAITGRAMPFGARGDGYQGVLLVFRDVTDRRLLEEELAKAGKLESLGLLAGGIAHDFNNLLTTILGNIALAIADSPEGSEQAALLSEAETACLRAKELTHQLLTLSRGGAPQRRLSSLPGLLSEAARFALRGEACELHSQVPGDLPWVEVDPGQIVQVVQNLVSNACEAMPTGGAVTISGQAVDLDQDSVPPLAPGRYVKVSVQDQGVGIPPEYLERIFDPYFTTKAKGQGLGLALAYSVVARHGGHIAVESTLGTGSSFHIYLPAAGEPSGRPAAPQGAVAGKPRRRHSGKILVMDDDEAVLQVSSKMLQRLGYRVETAAEGNEAVAKYQAAMAAGAPFDAVLLDLVVAGGMGGRETLETLKEIDPPVKAVVASGYSDDPVMGQYAKHGFGAMISKPYRLEDLEAALDAVASAA